MLIMIITSLLVLTGIISFKDKVITVDKLPDAARSFIDRFYPEATVSHVKEDSIFFKTSYAVLLQDGNEIEFNSKGEWKRVDSEQTVIPAGLIPADISGYVRNSFPGQNIVKIGKETYGYKIELANDLKLKFDKKGKLISIDD